VATHSYVLVQGIQQCASQFCREYIPSWICRITSTNRLKTSSETIRTRRRTKFNSMRFLQASHEVQVWVWLPNVVAASNLHPATPEHYALKFADDTFSQYQLPISSRVLLRLLRPRTLSHLIGLNLWRLSLCRRASNVHWTSLRRQCRVLFVSWIHQCSWCLYQPPFLYHWA